MGNPAWQVREYQRQQLLEKLLREACDLQDRSGGEGGNYFLLEIALAVLQELEGPGHSGNRSIVSQKFFDTVVLPQVKDFSRSDEECQALLARFVQKHLLSSALNSIHGKLVSQEVHEPLKIFGVADCNTEVELPTP